MDNKIVDNIADAFNSDLPPADTMDEYLDKIIPQIRHHSEDLREEKFYVEKHWIEFRDDDDFHEITMHIFNPEGEYLRSIDGDYHAGEWRYLSNKLIFGFKESEGEIYELAFLDGDFFILKKHGNPKAMERRYFVLVKEAVARKVEWRQALELLFNKYKNNNSFYITVAVIILLIIAIIFALS
ncbi:MAG: hypothetical protein KDC85_03740 [Saprospiraceae bacterium]|nr:hypothetical protein [Saprospiraceae bacterium]MCB9326768.1 hypothetical protein [Lewinellaceae bacterium]